MTVDTETPFELSIVDGPTDTTPCRVAGTWGEFLFRLAGCETRGDLGLEEYLAADKATRNAQKAGPGWIPAVFRHGGRRVDADVLGTTAIVGDLDDGKLDRAELARRLNGYAHAGHTSYSHAPGSPRYRVVVPLARPLPPARYGGAWERLNALLGGALDPSGRNPSHFYYLPAVPPGGEAFFEFWSADGEALDPDKPEGEPSPEAPGPAPEVDLDALVVSDRIRRLIREGLAADTEGRYGGDRSRAVFAVLVALAAAGLADEQIVAVLTHEEHALSAAVLEHAKRPERVARWLAPQIKKARERVAAGDAPADVGPGRPTIRIVDGELARIVRESEAALLAAGGLYQRGGVPVHVRRVEDARPVAGLARALGTPVIAACSAELLVLRLATDAVFTRYSGRRKTWVPTNPPPYAGRYLLAKGEWAFPPLTGVVNAPTLRADGSILDVEGYDPATGLLVDFDGVAFPPVPTAPTRGEARAALDRLAALIVEFPFADPGEGTGRVSRAVLLAALLTAPVRRSLPTAPLVLIDAPKPGTGKTFAAELVAVLATGRPPAIMAHAVDGAEERKRLLSSLLAGDAVTVIDNVEAVLRSDVLCAVLTAASYRDRLLGQNVNATVPTATVWLANGNNVTVQGDLTRRVLLCRMDAGVETPDARTFRGNPRGVLEARRPELLVDALAVLRAHHVAGRPAPGLAPFGSFEVWSGWVRAALVWLGEADPLGNRPALEANDPEREALRNLLTAWDDEHGESTVLAGELARRHADWTKTADRHDPLAEALDAIPRPPRADLTPRVLGKYLQSVRDKVEGGRRLRRVGTHQGTALWRVEATAGGGFGGSGGSASNPSREQFGPRSTESPGVQ